MYYAAICTQLCCEAQPTQSHKNIASLWSVGADHRLQEKLNNMNIEKEGIKMFMSWLVTIDKNFQWQISNCQSHVKKQIIMSAQSALRDTLDVFADELEEE